MVYGSVDRWFPNNPRTIAVVDTDALLSSIDNDCRSGRDSSIVQMSRFGTVRLYAADHVYDELHHKLPKFVRPDVALEQLEQRLDSYLQLISFVDVPEGHDLQREAQVAAVTDESDVPTAVLATLLAPCVVLSGDKHLRRPGFAPDEWRPVARSGRDVADGDTHVLGVSLAVVGPSAGLVLAGRWTAAKLEMPSWVPLAILAGGALAYLGSPVRRRRLWEKAGPFVESTLNLLADSMESQRRGLEELKQAAIPTPSDPTLDQQVARCLATAGEPLLVTEVHQQLPSHSTFTRSDVVELLRASSVFVPRGKRWQLGRGRQARMSVDG
jgi:predicted nucleic acid-binding protein